MLGESIDTQQYRLRIHRNRIDFFNFYFSFFRYPAYRNCFSFGIQYFFIPLADILHIIPTDHDLDRSGQIICTV